MTIGIIGSGAIGSTIARLAVSAGFEVVISNTRGIDSLSELISELGRLAKAATVDDAALSGDIVIVTVPFQSYNKLPVEALRGKVVIDTMNYYPVRDGHFAEVDSGEITTSELLQRHLRNSIVIKTLHNQDAKHLLINATSDTTKRTTLPVAGDHLEAKAKVMAFVSAIGYNTIDSGTLAESWRIGPGTPIYVWPYVPAVPENLDIEKAKEFYSQTPGSPLSLEDADKLVAKAERKFPVGGVPEDLPPTWVAIVREKVRR